MPAEKAEPQKFSPFGVFLRPKKTVLAAITSPKPAYAGAFIFLAWLFWVFSAMLLETSTDALFFGKALAADLIILLVFCVLAFIAAKAAKSKVGFSGILTAYSLTKMLEAVFFVIIVLALVSVPNIGPKAQGFQDTANNAVMEELFSSLTSSPLGLALAVIGTVALLWFSILYFYISFLTVHNSAKISAFKSIVLLLVFLAVCAIASTVVGNFL